MRHWVCIYLVLLGLFAASASTFSCPNADVSFGLEPDTYICPTHATGGYEYQWLQPKSGPPGAAEYLLHIDIVYTYAYSFGLLSNPKVPQVLQNAFGQEDIYPVGTPHTDSPIPVSFSVDPSLDTVAVSMYMGCSGLTPSDMMLVPLLLSALMHTEVSHVTRQNRMRRVFRRTSEGIVRSASSLYSTYATGYHSSVSFPAPSSTSVCSKEAEGEKEAGGEGGKGGGTDAVCQAPPPSAHAGIGGPVVSITFTTPLESCAEAVSLFTGVLAGSVFSQSTVLAAAERESHRLSTLSNHGMGTTPPGTESEWSVGQQRVYLSAVSQLLSPNPSPAPTLYRDPLTLPQSGADLMHRLQRVLQQLVGRGEGGCPKRLYVSAPAVIEEGGLTQFASLLHTLNSTHATEGRAGNAEGGREGQRLGEKEHSRSKPTLCVCSDNNSWYTLTLETSVETREHTPSVTDGDRVTEDSVTSSSSTTVPSPSSEGEGEAGAGGDVRPQSDIETDTTPSVTEGASTPSASASASAPSSYEATLHSYRFALCVVVASLLSSPLSPLSPYLHSNTTLDAGCKVDAEGALCIECRVESGVSPADVIGAMHAYCLETQQEFRYRRSALVDRYSLMLRGAISHALSTLSDPMTQDHVTKAIFRDTVSVHTHPARATASGIPYSRHLVTSLLSVSPSDAAVALLALVGRLSCYEYDMHTGARSVAASLPYVLGHAAIAVSGPHLDDPSMIGSITEVLADISCTVYPPSGGGYLPVECAPSASVSHRVSVSGRAETPRVVLQEGRMGHQRWERQTELARVLRHTNRRNDALLFKLNQQIAARYASHGNQGLTDAETEAEAERERERQREAKKEAQRQRIAHLKRRLETLTKDTEEIKTQNAERRERLLVAQSQLDEYQYVASYRLGAPSSTRGLCHKLEVLYPRVMHYRRRYASHLVDAVLPLLSVIQISPLAPVPSAAVSTPGGREGERERGMSPLAPSHPVTGGVSGMGTAGIWMPGLATPLAMALPKEGAEAGDWFSQGAHSGVETDLAAWLCLHVLRVLCTYLGRPLSVTALSQGSLSTLVDLSTSVDTHMRRLSCNDDTTHYTQGHDAHGMEEGIRPHGTCNVCVPMETTGTPQQRRTSLVQAHALLRRAISSLALHSRVDLGQ
ncbi:hypothetical protein KIPB_003913, partial [Kipferlia bialata]|eukprot:g3913.t1